MSRAAPAGDRLHSVVEGNVWLSAWWSSQGPGGHDVER